MIGVYLEMLIRFCSIGYRLVNTCLPNVLTTIALLLTLSSLPTRYNTTLFSLLICRFPFIFYLLFLPYVSLYTIFWFRMCFSHCSSLFFLPSVSHYILHVLSYMFPTICFHFLYSLLYLFFYNVLTISLVYIFSHVLLTPVGSGKE